MNKAVQMNKILGITGIRSDYDLMTSLYNKFMDNPEIDFRLLVGSAHLSKTYGHTIDNIIDDGFPILSSIECLIDSDTPSSRLKTASIMLMNSIDIVSNWSPDIIIYAGDREEVWIGAMLGTYLEIPTVHFYGGDHTITGHVDNPVRHAVSKLSTVHMVAMEEHKKRLLLMGESANRIHVIGNMSLDNFMSTRIIPLLELKKQIGMRIDFNNFALLIFHPDPSEKSVAGTYFENILLELKSSGINTCVSYPNTDPANKSIIDLIEKHKNEKTFYFYKNLNRDQFISLYKYSRFIIGNSSSGIMEAASIPIPAINVGLRQVGRFAGKNVIFCRGDRNNIAKAIKCALSSNFRKTIKDIHNPYGNGKSTEKAYKILLKHNFNAIRLKKEDPLVTSHRIFPLT